MTTLFNHFKAGVDVTTPRLIIPLSNPPATSPLIINDSDFAGNTAYSCAGQVPATTIVDDTVLVSLFTLNAIPSVRYLFTVSLISEITTTVGTTTTGAIKSVIWSGTGIASTIESHSGTPTVNDSFSISGSSLTMNVQISTTPNSILSAKTGFRVDVVRVPYNA